MELVLSLGMQQGAEASAQAAALTAVTGSRMNMPLPEFGWTHMCHENRVCIYRDDMVFAQVRYRQVTPNRQTPPLL